MSHTITARHVPFTTLIRLMGFIDQFEKDTGVMPVVYVNRHTFDSMRTDKDAPVYWLNQMSMLPMEEPPKLIGCKIVIDNREPSRLVVELRTCERAHQVRTVHCEP